jgi:GrpB-like predicted nucleotidyltransferase (UPF0157 family)
VVIVIVDHDPRWTGAFEAERRRLAAALGPAAPAIEHIGSTSVPGLPAKPIIDLMAGLADMRDAGRCCELLAGLGYRRAPEGDFEGRVFLRRACGGVVTHHLSLAPHRGAYWNDQVAFRDALRADAALRRRYADLKRRLAAVTGADPEAYTRAKTDLVREALLSTGHVPRSGWAAGGLSP